MMKEVPDPAFSRLLKGPGQRSTPCPTWLLIDGGGGSLGGP